MDQHLVRLPSVVQLERLWQPASSSPIVQFDKIEVDFQLVSSTDLSTDQQYLLQICQAVTSRNCSVDLSMHNPGKIVHSRWLTTAIGFYAYMSVLEIHQQTFRYLQLT